MRILNIKRILVEFVEILLKMKNMKGSNALNKEKLIYSILREVGNDCKFYSDKKNVANDRFVLTYDMFVSNKDIFDEILNEIENIYVWIRPYVVNENIKLYWRDLTDKGRSFLKEHNYWDKEYPGLNAIKLKKWIEE